MNSKNMHGMQELQSTRRIRTLLVDDSDLMREFLTILLSRQGGFELVGTAADGRQALRCAASLRPALILMDVQMPNLDGLQATRIIKEFGARVDYEPVIVIVTAEDTLECRSQAEAAGADGFVPKTLRWEIQLKTTLGQIFSGNCLARPVNLTPDCHESSCP